MQESLSLTTGVVMIDDPTISKIFSEFLLQVQGGLLSGSNSEGMSAPKAAVLMTSNSEELPRYTNQQCHHLMGFVVCIKACVCRKHLTTGVLICLLL
jgi:hypothetical protein